MKFPPENGLVFEFNDDHWAGLLHFDLTNDYKHAKDALPGTKGVDFTGVLGNQTLVFIEAKNFRGHRIESKPRLENGEDPIWLEAAQKMRDSISVVVGSARNSTHLKVVWQRYLEYFGKENKYIHFVLWLEQDMPPNNASAKRKWEKNEIENRRSLKRCLRWLTNKVDIASIQNNPFPDSLAVSYQ
ncbi:MAG: hypothetical protein MUC59_05245 [Saprospiraceae bacterium]|jgi:hypothetical protein|nr:hypothetical protein [Saprospiraceae bacterium]